MRRGLIYSIYLSVICVSCNTSPGPRENTYPLKINLAEAFINEKILNLSDIADSISYIKLEPVKDKPVRSIYYFAFFSGNIFIDGGRKTGVLHYDSKGKFLNTISKAGSGYGQYLPGSDFSITDNSRRIYVLTKFAPRKIMIYDYSGYLLNEFRISVSSFGGFEAISDNRFLFLTGPMEQESGKEEYMARLTDRNDHIISEIERSHPPSDSGRNNSLNYNGLVSGKYFAGAPLFYDGNSMDTIYSVKNDSIYPRYAIVMGKRAVSRQLNFSDPATKSSEELNLCLIPSSFAETPRHVFLTFICGDTSYVAAYDKSNKSVSSMKSRFNELDMENNPPMQFKNDIDGGLSVTTGKTNRQGNVWLYIYSSSYFRNKIVRSPAFTKSINPEKQKSLRKFAASLPETDDPIVMAVYLKRSE